MKSTIFSKINGEAILLALLSVFAPIQSIVVVVTLLILADFITGIMASMKKKVKIESSKMSKTVSRFLISQSAICLTFLTQTFLLQDSFPLVNVVAGVIGIKEIYSVMENLNTLSGNNLLTEVLSKLSSINYKGDEVKKESAPEDAPKE